MSAEQLSTSGSEIQPQSEGSSHDLYITHRVSKMDTLAGLAVRYHVTVADIKRANGLLSDTAMFAKETLLVPTRSIPVGLEYSTWAGMIVAQYGRIPGDHHQPGNAIAFRGTSPPRQSAALDQLQRYYGTGDTASEPSDFRPGDPDGTESVSGTEIELSDMDHLGRLVHRGSEGQQECSGSVEYAGSRSGSLADERLRRRKADLSPRGSPLRGSDGGEMPGTSDGASAATDGVPSTSGRPTQHRRALTQSQHLGKRESILERLKRVASQPALAVPHAPSLARISDAVLAPLADSLPPLPPGANRNRERPSVLLTPRQKDKEVRKAD